jgi:hypothetical protein
MSRTKINRKMSQKPNRKQSQNIKLQNTINLIYPSTSNNFNSPNTELCRGDKLSCGQLKSLSSLKCICKDSGKKIREENRKEKIRKNENHYIYEKNKK